MKLSAIYTVWNGLELLEGSIKQIEPFCDDIIICWQLYSNKGERSEEIKGKIAEIQKRWKDKIHLLEYKPDFQINTKGNEARKHNEALRYARSIGSTHFFLSACDHYYRSGEFVKAKYICEAEGYDVTFTRLYTYYKKPTWRISPIEDPSMPFICKINTATEFFQVSGYPVHVDPACRVIPILNYHQFPQNEIMMHHYSMVRIDVDNKFRNAAASIRWSSQQIDNYRNEYNTAKIGDKISYFRGRKLIEVEDIFYLSD